MLLYLLPLKCKKDMAGDDIAMNQFQIVTDADYVYVEKGNNQGKIKKEDLANIVGEIMANLGSFFIPLKNKIYSANTDLKTISTQGIYPVQGSGVGIRDDGLLIVLDSVGGTVRIFLGTNGNFYFYSSSNMDDWAKIYSSQVG